MYSKVSFLCACLTVKFFIFLINYNAYAQVLRNSYSDIYRDERRNQQFPSDYYDRYPSNERYRDRQFQASPNRKVEQFVGDSRCVFDKHLEDSFNTPISVRLRLGIVVGINVSLCDGPGVPERDRPHSRTNYSPNIYRNIAVFLGIPYAEPPIKDRRFKPPQVQPSFNSISARQYRSPCPQNVNYTGLRTGIDLTNEDCLYLNVFTPTVQIQYEKYAVMVYIHGGDWDHGSANVFPAHMLTASQNVTVVTFNYRLGPLGFYANGENSSAGNYGLLDQAMAIEWVYDNIDAFNGDRERITLFGPGVGAASAGIHALSDRLGKKIRRVIAQSGSAVAEWAVLSDNYTIFNNSLEYASLFNCQFQSSWRTVECLAGESLIKHENNNFKPKVGWFPWSPVIDYCTREEGRRILPDMPENLIKYHYENLHSNFAYLTGVTRDEAATMLLKDEDFRKNFRVTKEMFQRKIHEYSHMLNCTLDVPAFTKAIEFMYLPQEKDIHNQTLMMQNYIDMLSDSYFKAPTDKMVKLLLQGNVKTYMYVLNSTLDGLKLAPDYRFRYIGDVVPHDTEYYLITGVPFMDPKLYPSQLNLDQAKWTEADRNLSNFFMTSWANFAKTGDPTPFEEKHLLYDIEWRPTTLHRMEYLSINTTNLTTIMLENYRQRESEFWNNYLHALMRKDVLPATYCRPLYEDWEDKKHTYLASFFGVLGSIGLFLLLSILCCCLYCRAKGTRDGEMESGSEESSLFGGVGGGSRKHVVSTEDIPDAISVTPSSIDTLLNMKRVEGGTKYYPERLHGEQKHTQV